MQWIWSVLIYNIKGCVQPISYVPLERYVLFKMNTSHQLFEMSLLLLLKNRVCKYNKAMHTPFVERIQNLPKAFWH